MNFVKLDEFMVKGGGSIDPKRFSEEVFELYSIPAFDTGAPEIVKGAEIGSTKKCVEPNDVLLSKIVPHIRRCFVVPKIGKLRQIASGEWIQFRSEKLIPDYLKYFLISNTFHGQFMSTVKGVGGSLLRGSPSQVANIKIPLQTLAEQQKIAAILDAADSLRQKDQQLVERYTALSQSLFLEMFGDPVTNPMGWRKESLGSIVSITSSKRIFEDEYVDTGVPFYRTREIVELSKGKKLSLELFISDERYSEIKSKFDIPKIGDILISAVGTIGVMWVVDTDSPFYFKDGNLIWMKASTTKNVNPVYLKMTLDHLLDYEKYKLAEGGAYNALTIAKLKEFGVLLAPLELQNKFAERIELIEAQKQQAQRGLEKSEALFNSLLQRAFTGELTAKMAA